MSKVGVKGRCHRERCAEPTKPSQGQADLSIPLSQLIGSVSDTVSGKRFKHSPEKRNRLKKNDTYTFTAAHCF